MRRLVHTSTIHSEEVFCMDQKKACNTSIKCSVSSCAYHNGASSCCTLDSMKVGCSDSNPTKCDGTECVSFKLNGMQ